MERKNRIRASLLLEVKIDAISKIRLNHAQNFKGKTFNIQVKAIKVEYKICTKMTFCALITAG